MGQRPKHLKKNSDTVRWFPNLNKKNHDVTSDEDPRYNCIAFAAGITNRKFWPTFYPDYYWPPGIPKLEKIEAFIKLYESYGYSVITDGTNGTYVPGVEKVAIFATQDSIPKHAARQIGQDRWASKLGESFDIEHKQNAVSGGQYGFIVVYMRRDAVIQ